mmetsp:Transcript_4733/g.11821  ORF Transcript_4733/g.11821 Transcript_4733/m.11821 type:complete len:282 (-) Transcript_4733:89-934(-)
MFGEEGLKQGAAPNGGGASSSGGFPAGAAGFNMRNPEDIFKEFFGGNSPFGGMGGGPFGGMGGMEDFMGSFSSGGAGGMPQMFSTGSRGPGLDPFRRGRSGKAPAIEKQLPCTLEDLYLGKSRKMKITRTLYDPSGQGVRAEEILQIDVKPGWKKGTRVTFPEKGDEAPGQTPADVVFIIAEKPHAYLSREGNNLIYKHRLTLADALCGASLQLKHLDGRTLRIPLVKPVSPGYTHIVRGEGMPISKHPGQKGDLHIKFDVLFPTALTEDQKTQLRAILPP